MGESLAISLSRSIGADAIHDAMTPAQRQAFKYLWRAWARPEQLAPPGDWFIWLLLAGRGFGKSRSSVEWLLEEDKVEPPELPFGIVGPTADNTRKVLVFGESGVLARCPPWSRPKFDVTNQCLQLRNGRRIYLLSADKPDMARGFQFARVLMDEIAAWRRLQETFDNLIMATRLGRHPRIAIATTPRPLALLKDLARRPDVVVTRGKTTDNAANLPESFVRTILSRYQGTTVGRQELEGELFDEMPGALWARAWIDEARLQTAERSAEKVLAFVRQYLRGAELRRIVVGVDPATTSHEESDECGIVVAALGERDGVQHCFVLEDGTEKLSPDAWARKVVGLVRKWGADCVVAETNLGGETIPSLIRLVDDKVKVIEKGGNRGKRTRAEPVAALYEQRRVHHVGLFSKLEDEYCTFTLETKKSPNCLDAGVYAVGELMFAVADDEPFVLL